VTPTTTVTAEYEENYRAHCTHPSEQHESHPFFLIQGPVAVVGLAAVRRTARFSEPLLNQNEHRKKSMPVHRRESIHGHGGRGVFVARGGKLCHRYAREERGLILSAAGSFRFVSSR